MTPINHLFQVFGNYAYHKIWGYELEATQKNLDWALQQSRDEILKYTFKDSSGGSYTILEFAVKSGDLQAVRILFQFGADFAFSPRVFGSILHFYMDCLEENRFPDLEMLHFLIDKIANIDSQDSHQAGTPLVRALNNMAHFTTVHWSVIEVLLSRAKVSGHKLLGPSPFEILECSDNDKIFQGKMVRSAEEEIIFLDNLVRYAELEKKYRGSNCHLTFEAFKLHTSNLRQTFSQIAINRSGSAFVGSIVSLATDMQTPHFFNNLEHGLGHEEITDIKEMANFYRSEVESCNSNEIRSLREAFTNYYKYFISLVREKVHFRDCFEQWQLNSIFSRLENDNTREAIKLVQFLGAVGISVQESAQDDRPNKKLKLTGPVES